jgi:hypothetical protein
MKKNKYTQHTWLEPEEKKIWDNHKMETGETIQYGLREAIKDYTKKLKKK